MKTFLKNVWDFCFSSGNWKLFGMFIILDALLTLLIIKKVPYTEIDWKAYMEEVEGFVNGELDYVNLRGNTGPLVYPAGFLYIFAFFRYLTNQGASVLAAQYLFGIVYIVNLAVMFAIYASTSIPSILGVALILSKRIHSIYVLRMFNDCIAMLFGYIAIYLFSSRRWRIGSIFYSLSVSVKMNMFLFAPGLFLCLLLGTNVYETFRCISICAVVQLLLGAPFLLTYPVSYITKAFEFGRVFTYKWTVNYKFLSEDVFVSKPLSIGLLILTVLAYGLFARKWLIEIKKKNANLPSLQSGTAAVTNALSKEFIVGTLLSSNVLGVIFARSLHYQFYSWYFHALPLLLYYCPLHYSVSAALLVVIEVCYNVYPSTAWSSLALQVCHLVLLYALYHSSIPSKVLCGSVSDISKREKIK